MTEKQPLRVGIGGPVGSGKTALLDRLCKTMRDDYQIAVVTNDIYTREDAEFLVRSEALDADRIVGVETGGCPHTAIREVASMYLAAVQDLTDLMIYVIDVSEGEKIPRKGGPGITRSDLLVINKIDLAPHVGASLEVMESDTKRMRGDKPFVFTNLKQDQGLEDVVEFVVREGMLA